MRQGGRRHVGGLTMAEMRRQRERSDRLAGKVPPPEGRALCIQCGGHIILNADGRLRSHRYQGWQCPGAGAKP